MTGHLVPVLRNLLSKGREEALAIGRDEPLTILFHNDGKPTGQGTIRNIFGRPHSKCGIEHRKRHTTRHTFACC